MFSKVLIANRGEIAIRVIRTCRDMGIKTVAIFSTADRKALHVTMADEAYCVGGPASADSYLQMDKIIALCKQTGAEAVHPGYGFLSENAVFANKLKDQQITLIGPSAESMQVMGSKLAAKDAVASYNVPMVPGVNKAIDDIEHAKQTAIDIGFPILIKASAGGGGKGMRLVEKVEEFENAMKMAQSEAISSFGDGAVFVEKFVTKPRHIEIQVMADNHGNVVHLFERECSIQRRHQKLVEEAPSAVLTPELRAQMGASAVSVAKACNYSGAGTVEFLLDADLNFYFLEMNTRLQVEHPVTELITGVDLVREQLNVAAGNPLSFSQEDLKITGHSIELRVCAEDPYNNFLPDIGKLTRYQIPKGNGVRVDDCVEEGMEIPIYYDNMIAKLVVHGKDRKEAIARLKRAISEYHIQGIKTTLHFGTFVMNHEAFISGNFDTGFIGKYFTGSAEDKLNKSEQIAASVAALTALKSHKGVSNVDPSSNSEGQNAWLKNRRA
ncbi:acetyl-CoA carboxylase biotin carboxylase subunit [Bacteroidia bacterium]|jgi:acetyl-CoA carboxylase biotin carboxylase subunit|nr:acetyl-CoA carboxylase biotin carboxylase subunit [Bacteroidia bacterium]